jgi:hypothetical protein
MPKITEIIPDKIPQWMKEAMDEGQFFNRVVEKVALLESRLKQFGIIECNSCDWIGQVGEADFLGAIGPLCPECKETTTH